ncbi:centrosomal protein of 290 kDa-like [Protopterus annectens]|uniref:centrosomal protein of 290 kDa-like n=1 Tax=Protopterus annectens TaxID=7888 RepID=UPI001CFB7B7A|nr:centrosomal protein of 290 kDa-like [Protopterus annectens]
MKMLPIHACMKLLYENEELHKKLKRLHEKNQVLENKLSQIQGTLHPQERMHVSSAARDAQVQTESKIRHIASSKEDKVAVDVGNNRAFQMYNTLFKRYQKEIKIRKEQNEMILELTEKTQKLELQLQDAKQRIQQLEKLPISKKESSSCPRRHVVKGSPSSSKWRSKQQSCSSSHLELLLESERLRNENLKIAKENKMLKNELAGLDKGFFDEIEDLKYALQESVKLNKEYEKCFQCISAKYGLTFLQPHRNLK